jgi:hypothetical protein
MYGGAALAVGAAAAGLALLFGRGAVLAGLAVLVLWLAGGYLLVRYGAELARVRSRRDARTAWWETGDDSTVKPLLVKLVEVRFRQHRPDGIDEDVWLRETERLRDLVGRRLTAQYGGRKSDFAPFDIDWLISWYAVAAADRWRSRHTVADAEPVRPPIKTGLRLLCAAGFAAAGLGVVLLVAGLSGWWVLLGLLPAAGVIGGLTLVGRNATLVLGSRELVRRDEERRQRQFEAEEGAFRRWQAALASRPTDAEMARWLDYDKAYVKHLAMRQFGLRNRDLIGHVVLTQADDVSMRARELYGPPRYSAYQIRLFLLTARGIREVNVHLDFLTGAVFNERRTTFQYSSITSADVGEVSVHLDAGKRTVKKVENGAAARTDNDKLTFAHALQLSLNNGSTTFVLIENFDQGLLDRLREDVRYLEELARDAAGVTGALRILEAIAAEGAAWVDEERRRRERRLRHYRERQQRRKGLEGPNLDFGPPRLPPPEEI